MLRLIHCSKLCLLAILHRRMKKFFKNWTQVLILESKQSKLERDYSQINVIEGLKLKVTNLHFFKFEISPPKCNNLRHEQLYKLIF